MSSEAALKSLLTTAVLALTLSTGAAVEGAPEPSKRHSLKAYLRSKVAASVDYGRYGLRLEDPAVLQARVVVLIHGFNSTPETAAGLLGPAREAHVPTAAFAYPNDQPLADSAGLLSTELKRLAAQRPKLRVTLVTHSMGGLVARACLEDPDADPGNVDRLIMVAPPTHGSMLAKVAVGTDLWEHWLGRRSGSPWRRLHDSIADGLGEAATDLAPGSDFLETLNGRPRHPGVTYTLILGSGGCVPDGHLQWTRENARGVLSAARAKKTAARVDHLIKEFDELVEGRGDGVVAIRRARLDGVDDVVVLPFGHLQVTDEESTGAAALARRAILSRLVPAP